MYGVFMKSFKHGVSRIGRHGRVLVAAAAVAVLGACGGGTSQIEPFVPKRIITFGDESSLITAEGKKYTVNGLDTTTNLPNCGLNPIWVQTLASTYGLVFPQCNPDHLANPPGLMYATLGAKVADVASKIDAHFSASFFNSKDMVTVYVGNNDIYELYAQFPAQGRESLIAEARTRGRALAEQVNRIANAGGRVLLSTLPDLGTTPFAQKEKNSKFDTDRAALLSELSNAFNIAMRLNVINDGRLIGLLLLDETTQVIFKYPTSFGYSNITEGACLVAVALENCTTNTLLTGATIDTWLWASDTLFGPAGQSRLAELAQRRAANNPF